MGYLYTTKQVRKIYPPHALLLAILTMLLLCSISSQRLFSSLYTLYSGAFLSIAGIYLIVHCRNLFISAETELTPFRESTTLITSGAFRFSRNPIYLGMLMVLLGIALQLNDPLPFIVPVIFFLWLYFSFIIPEEAMMEDLFADRYLKYKSRIRRWV